MTPRTFSFPSPLWPQSSLSCKSSSGEHRTNRIAPPNGPDWRILREIMRSDMSKPCRRWKAWGCHECFKKCSMVSRLDEGNFHGSHINPIYLTATSPCVLLRDWPQLDQMQTKPTTAFTRCIWIQRRMERELLQFHHSKRQYSTSLAFTLEVKMMLYLALYTISQSERGRTADKMVMSRFTTRITFSTDQSDFVSSFVLRSQVGSVHVVLTLVEVWVPFLFFFVSPHGWQAQQPPAGRWG